MDIPGMTLQEKFSFTPTSNPGYFLLRNLYGCNRRVKKTSYKTFTRPIMEYAATVWNLLGHVTLSKNKKINKKKTESREEPGCPLHGTDAPQVYPASSTSSSGNWHIVAQMLVSCLLLPGGPVRKYIYHALGFYNCIAVHTTLVSVRLSYCSVAVSVWNSQWDGDTGGLREGVLS